MYTFELPPLKDEVSASDRDFNALANIINAPVASGNVLDRWRDIVNTMLERIAMSESCETRLPTLFKGQKPESIGTPATVSAKRLVPTSTGRHAARP
jgi:hypothetical protein